MRVQAFNPLVAAPKSSFDDYWTVVNMRACASCLSFWNALVISQMDFNPGRVQIDVNASTLPGFKALSAQTSDTVPSVTGVLTYSFESYDVGATEPFTVTSGGLSQAATSLTKNSMNFLIATMNVLKLDPSDNIFTDLANIIINRLDRTDIVALQEVQDNDGAASSQVTSASQTLQMLVDTILHAVGPTDSWADNNFIGDETNGGEPGGNIRAVYIYLDSRVELVSLDTVTDPSVY